MQPGGVSVEWLNMKCLSPMLLWSVAVLATAVIPVASQTPPEQTPSFELISIKPTPANWRGGRFTAMNGAHQFVARNYTVQFMLMTAYNLLPREITGGPTWIDSDAYDIVGTTPGGVRPKGSVFDPTPAQQNVTLIDAATLRDAERLIESCEHCNPVGSEIPFDWILDLGGPRVVEEENYRNDQATRLCGKAVARRALTSPLSLWLRMERANRTFVASVSLL